MAIKIEIVSDVSQVVADTGKLADRYDDVSDTLKDLAKAGDRAGDQIEDAFKDGVREAKKLDDAFQDGEKAAKDLDRKADDAFDAISKNAKRAGDDVGKSQKDGFREAGEGSETFKEEAQANAKEVAASFDGSAESIADGFQGLAAEMLSGFGPAGVAAGIAVAAGLGMASMAMQDTAEKANAARQRAVDMVDAIADAGGSLEDMDLAEQIKSWGREVLEDNWITFWADESTTRFQETAKDAKDAGVNIRDALRAGAGSAQDSQKFLDATADAWQRLTKEIDRGTSTTEDGLQVQDDSAKAALKQRNALSDLRGQAEENVKATENALEIYELETQALDATAEAAEAAADAIKDKADASDAAADAALSVVGAENSWIETLKQMNEDIKSNGKNLDSNTQAGRDNKTSLVDLASAANTYRDAQIAAGEKTGDVTNLVQGQRDAFIKAAEAAGYGAGEAQALADKYGLIPGNVETLVKANGTEEAKAAIDSIPEAAKTDVAVTTSGLEQAQTGISGIQGTEVKAEVKESGTAETQAAVDGIKGKDVKIDVQDFNTVRQTQDRIDGLRGRDVPITVSITNLAQIQSTISALTAPRSMWITVNERAGVQAP